MSKFKPEQIEEYNFYRFGHPIPKGRQSLSGPNYDPHDDDIDDIVHEFGIRIIKPNDQLDNLTAIIKENKLCNAMISKMDSGKEKKTKVYCPPKYQEKIKGYKKKDPKIKKYETAEERKLKNKKRNFKRSKK